MATKRTRKNRAPKERKITTSSGEVTISPGGDIYMTVQKPDEVYRNGGAASTERIVKAQDTYAVMLPHEIVLFKDQIKDFYKEIRFKEGCENIDLFVSEVIKTVASNHYQFFYVALDKDNKPLGFTWFWIGEDVMGQSYGKMEMDYIVPEIRDTLRGARVHKNLIQFVVNVGSRANVQYFKTAVRTQKLEASRKKLGFKSIEIHMTFEGNGADFIAQNPMFQQYSKS